MCIIQVAEMIVNKGVQVDMLLTRAAKHDITTVRLFNPKLMVQTIVGTMASIREMKVFWSPVGVNHDYALMVIPSFLPVNVTKLTLRHPPWDMLRRVQLSHQVRELTIRNTPRKEDLMPHLPDCLTALAIWNVGHNQLMSVSKMAQLHTIKIEGRLPQGGTFTLPKSVKCIFADVDVCKPGPVKDTILQAASINGLKELRIMRPVIENDDALNRAMMFVADVLKASPECAVYVERRNVLGDPLFHLDTRSRSQRQQIKKIRYIKCSVCSN